jgi:hypothetical protein
VRCPQTTPMQASFQLLFLAESAGIQRA